MKKLLLVFIIFLSGCTMTTQNDYDINEETKKELKEQLLAELKDELKIEYQPSLSEFENRVVSIVQSNSKALVGVTNLQTVDNTLVPASTGSGVIYKYENGYYYAITNEHVVDGAEYVQVLVDDEITIEAELLGQDKITDIAVVKFQYEEALKVSSFSDSDNLVRGQIAIAIGNPLGYEYFGTVTMGVISGLSRGIDIDYDNDNIIDWKATLIQHDASISPGNSGGPLYDINGNVIGINNMKIVESNVSNIGFAIPANTAMEIANVLEEKGEVKRPLLGITGQEVSIVRLRGDVNIPEEITGGVYIDTIAENGSVDGTGIKSGDIIVKYNDIDIVEFDDLRASLNNSFVGETVVITVYRDGQYLEYDVVLKERPKL